MRRNIMHKLMLLLALLLSVGRVFADDSKPIQITVNTLMSPMPAAATEYYQNPGKYFSIALTNTGGETPRAVRLHIGVYGPIKTFANDINQSDGSFIRVATNKVVGTSFIVPVGQTRVIAPIEMDQHLRQFPKGSLQMQGELKDFLYNVEHLGLMEEGHYGIQVEAVSNMTDGSTEVLGTGYCYFDICYNASAPTFTQPYDQSLWNSSDELQSHYIDETLARFAWTIPQFNSAMKRTHGEFYYDFRLMRLVPGQSPSQATTVAFQQLGLMTNFCDIPQSTLAALKKSGRYYVAQVTARPVYTSASNGNYVMIQNNGKSPLMLVDLNKEADNGGETPDVNGDGDNLPIEVNITKLYDRACLTTEIKPYYETPSQLFAVSLKNKSQNTEEICGMLQYYKDDWGLTIATAKQHTDRHMTLAAGQTIDLTAEQIDYLFGGYAVPDDIQEFHPHSGKIIGKLSKEHFEETIADTAYCRICRWAEPKPIIKQTTIGKGRQKFDTENNFSADQMAVVYIEKKYATPPVTSYPYFMTPSRLFKVTLDNWTNQSLDMKAIMVYEFNYEDHRFVGDYPSSEISDLTVHLDPKEERVLTDEEVDKLFGYFTKVHELDDNDKWIKTLENLEDLVADPDIDSKAEVRLYRSNAPMNDIEQLTNESTYFVGDGSITFRTSPNCVLRDFDLEVQTRQEKLPTKGEEFFTKPGLIFDLKLTNTLSSEAEIVIFPTYRNATSSTEQETEEDDDNAKTAQPDLYYMGDIYSAEGELRPLKLNAKESKTLTQQEINEFSGREFKQIVTSKDGYAADERISLNEMPDWGKTDDKLECIWRVMGYDSYKALIQERSITEEDIIGVDSIEATLSEDAFVGTIQIEVEKVVDPMPQKTTYYFQSPSLLFKVKMKNISDHDVNVLPTLELTNSNDSTVMGNWKEKVEKVFLLHAGEEKSIEAAEMNNYFAGFEKYLINAQPGEMATMEYTGRIDSLASNDTELTVTFRAFDHDLIKESAEKLEAAKLLEYALAGRSVQKLTVDPNASLGSVAIKLEAKKEQLEDKLDKLQEKPSDYFDITLINLDSQDHEVSLNLCYNNQYYAPTLGEENRMINVVSGDTLKLSAEQIDKLVGGFKLSDLMAIDAKTGEHSKASNPEFKEGKNIVVASVLEAHEGQKADTLSCDSVSFLTALRTVTINEFKLTLTSTSVLKDKSTEEDGTCYKGEGYITWKPGDLVEMKVNCVFDTIWVNDENIVSRGRVNSKKKEVNGCYIPYEYFDSHLGTNIASMKQTIQTSIESYGYGEYYDWVNDSFEVAGDALNLVRGEPVTLPIGIDSTSMLMKKCPVGIQMLSAGFTPDSSWVNLLGTYKFEETSTVSAENNVLLFAAPFLRIHPTTLLPESGTLGLMSDVTFKDMSTGFSLTCHAPSGIENIEDLKKAQDGCRVSWSEDFFQELCLDASVVIPGIAKDDGKGNLLDESGNTVSDFEQAAHPSGRFTCLVDRDNNWSAQIRLDPFQIESAEGFTFDMTGTDVGITYDHSKRWTNPGIKFHKDYDFTKEEINKKWSKEKTEGWMGLYWERLFVRFPDWLPSIGNDSTNISLAMRDLMYDATGFTSTFEANDLIKAHKDNWEFSLEHISLAIVQNDFNNFGFNGKMAVPFLDGTICYEASVTCQNVETKKAETEEKGTEEKKDAKAGTEEKKDTEAAPETEKQVKLQFKTSIDKDDTLKVNFLPVVNLAFTKSEFDISWTKYSKPELHNDKKSDFEIKMVFSGELGLQTEQGAGFDMPEFHFYNMYIANKVLTLDPVKHNSLLSFDGPTWHNGKQGGDGKDATFAFSLGNWSLASLEKKLGPFTIGLEKFEVTNASLDDVVQEDGTTHKIAKGTFDIIGKVNVVSGISVGASAGLEFPLSFDFETKKAKCDSVKFKEIGVTGDLAGLKLDGKLEVIDGASSNNITLPANTVAKGFYGAIKLTLPGDLIELQTAGAFVKAEAKDDNGQTDKFSAGFLEIAMEATAGINLGPVQMNGFSGGFYINMARSGVTNDDEGELILKHGMYGGMFGLHMADAAGTLVNGGFKLYVFYDARAYQDSLDNWHGRLSEVRLLGDLHAITKDAKSDGLINADAMLLYKDTRTIENNVVTGGEHFVEVSITVSGSAENALVDVSSFQDKLQKITGDMSKTLGAYQASANVEESGAMKDEQGKKSEGLPAPDESLADANKEEGKSGDVKCSPPSFEVNIEFKIDLTKKPRPWYVHVGTPTAPCKLTYIDFEFGNQTVGAGAKMGANAYICLGNTLPDLPDLPSKVKTFLYGSTAIDTGTNSTDTRKDELKGTFSASDAKGGLMVGAEVYGKFWCNALIGYAELEYDAGFDIALLKLKPGFSCAETYSAPGKNGWYGEGQAYAYLKGSLGVMIKFFGEVHKYPIIEAEAGAMLKAGLPNPSWFLGKFRAKGSAFGGLIKFDRSMSVKAGNVCTPVVSSPLTDIEIFADVTPGLDDQDKAYDSKNIVSVESNVIFTTNMTVGQPLELLDENEQARNPNRVNNRIFTFFIDDKLVQEKVGDSWRNASTTELQMDAERWKLRSANRGEWKPYTEYRIFLRGHATEQRNGIQTWPYFVATTDGAYDVIDAPKDSEGKPKATTYKKDKATVRQTLKAGDFYQQPWYDTLIYYFKTGETPMDLESNIRVAYPLKDKEYVLQDEMENPTFGMQRPIMSSYTNSGSNSENYLLFRVVRHNKLQYNVDPKNPIPQYDPTEYELIVEDRLVEEIKDNKYIRWRPEHQNADGKTWGSASSGTKYVWHEYTRINNQGNYVPTSYPYRMPYKMQIIQVSRNQKQAERTKVEDAKYHAFEIVAENDQLYGQTTTDVRNDVIVNNMESFSKSFAEQLNDTKNKTLDKGLDLGKLGSTNDAMKAIATQALSFKNAVNNELGFDSDTIQHTLSEDEKNRWDQSEVVLWEREFYLYQTCKEEGTRELAWADNFKYPKNFAAACQNGSVAPDQTYGARVTVDGNSNDFKVQNTENAISFGVTLVGITSNADAVKYDNSALSSPSLSDPFIRLAYMTKYGFFSDYIHKNKMLKDSHIGQMSLLSVQVVDFSVNNKSLIWQTQGTTQSFGAASATTSAELATKHELSDMVQFLYPSTWKPINIPETRNPSYFARAIDGNGNPYFTGKNVNTLYKKTKYYLNSFASTTSSLFESYKRRITGFEKNTGFSASRRSMSNMEQAPNYLDWIPNAPEELRSGYSGEPCVTIRWDRRQVQMLYARLLAETSLTGAGLNDWFSLDYVPNWTQRYFKDGKIYYFKNGTYIYNKNNSWTYYNNIIKAATFDAYKWLNTQSIYIKAYRPNCWDATLGTGTVIDWDSYSNSNTNTVDSSKHYNDL